MRYAASWCFSPNFGDALTPWLLKELGKGEAAWVTPGTPLEHYLITGSVLNASSKHSIAWGPGLASWKDEVFAGADIRAARGPLSLMRARSCGWEPKKGPAAIGDPALLLPTLVQAGQKTGKTGIVPHYVDMARLGWANQHNVSIIDPLLPVEKFCEQVSACDKIVSSSLHGLIVADAYRVPNAWIRLGDGIGGDGMKYWDYLASVGRSRIEYPPTCEDWRSLNGTQILEAAVRAPAVAAPAEIVAELQRGLMKSCPFLVKS